MNVPIRPVYHYAPARNWLSDPNGLVYADGEWHMFYQYNPHGDRWGHMAWGHAVSPDLVTWTELAPALEEDERHLVFSGSAVIDAAGVAGFGAGALVSCYTGAAHAGDRQVQCLAASTDRGRHWTKFAGNPVLDRGIADFRDPNIFWHAPSARWVMIVALSAENRALIYASDDLRRWDELSAIGPFDLAGRIWECPLLIELPVEGGDETRWLFKVDLLAEGPGSGAVAMTGTFDGTRFTPDPGPDRRDAWLVVDEGRDFYAAIAWHAPRDAAGRPCWIGWLGNHGYQAALPCRGWRGAMSVPRRIALRPAEHGYRLVQTIEPSLENAFGPVTRSVGATVRLEVPMAARIGIDRGEARDLRIALVDAAGTRIGIALDADTIAIDRTADFDTAFDAPIRADGFHGTLQMWLDVASLEIGAADGTRWISIQHCLAGETATLELTSDAPVQLEIAGFGADRVQLPTAIREPVTGACDGR